MTYQIEKDGSISILHHGRILLQNLCPGTDHGRVSVMRTETAEKEVVWETADGEIVCRAENDAEGALELFYSFRNWKTKIHTFFPIYQIGTEADGFYQAAEGMGHDTGYYTEWELLKKRNTASYGLCALKLGSCALTIYTLNRAELEPTGEVQDGFWYETVFEMDAYQREQYTNGFRKNQKETVKTLSCGIRVEETNGAEVTFSPIKFLVTERMEDGLEKAAAEIGRYLHARKQMEPAYHWCSWYYCYHNFDMVQLREYLAGLNRLEQKVPIKYVQIDAGYFPAMGDWLLPNERFKNGLQEAFREIKDAGYQPGIWIGPLMVGNRSRLYKEHPDWILYDTEGRPVRPWITDNEPKPWGYQDEEYYALDTSHPDAMEYMRQVFTTLHEMGAVMFKTDFMLWGLQDSTKVRRHTPGKTSVEYFRDFLRMIRKAIGEDSYWLGCIAPFLPFVGFADGMRIAGDVGSSWSGEFGPQNMMQCLIGNNYTNHNYYQTDPDAVMLRDFHIRLTEREICSLALLAAVSGSCIYTSDPLHLLPEERLQLFRFLEPDKKRRKPHLPFLTEQRREIVMVHREDNRGLLYLMNKSEETVKETYALEELGIPADWNVYRIKTGEKEELWRGKLVAEIPPHGCRLFLASRDEDVCISLENIWKNL